MNRAKRGAAEMRGLTTERFDARIFLSDYLYRIDT